MHPNFLKQQLTFRHKVQIKERPGEDDAIESDEEHSARLSQPGRYIKEGYMRGDNCAAVMETEESQAVLWALRNTEGVAGVFV